MYSFTFRFTDGHALVCDHVVSVSYGYNAATVVSGAEISEHPFPPQSTFYLKTTDGSYIVDGTNCRSIQIVNENA